MEDVEEDVEISIGANRLYVRVMEELGDTRVVICARTDRFADP